MKLITPSTQYKAPYLDMLADWKTTGEKVTPFTLKYDTNDFDAFVNKLIKFQTVADEGFVCHSTFWLFNEDDVIVGVSNLRHELNDKLLLIGGHIGYGIRPSYRKRGYATKILELSLIEAQKRGIEKALVTCDKINIASKKTILKNGGIFWEENLFDGMMILKYWIDIKTEDS